MALDFTNVDPKDPNGIYSLDATGAIDAWVNDDWSVVAYSQGEATKKGLKNRVRVATAITNEGKKYDVIVDERGSPISQIGATTGVEPPVVQAWRTQQTQTQRQQDQGERRVTSTYQSTYPEGHPQAGQPAMRTDYENGPPKYEPMPREAAANAVPANAVPNVEGTPRPDGTFDNSKPIMVWRTPDGKQVDANPLTADQRSQWEREKNQGAGVGARTDAQVAEAGAKAAKDAEPTITIKAVKQPDGSTKNVQVRIYPDGREEVVPSAIPGDPAPQTKPQPNERGAPVRGGDGKIYYPVQKFDPATNTVVSGYEDEQGKPTGPPPKAEPQKPKYTSVHQDKDSGKWYGLTTEGRWEEMQGGPGATPATSTTRAPSMPQFIVGASQDALRSAYDDIQAEVDAGRRTPAWGENRRKEVYETAQLTVNEAHLHEQSRQFNQSQAFNVANARMHNQQGVMEFALRSALSINGKIKKGSSAGAELFRGLFNLGMRMQADSGINNIRPGGGQSSIPGAPGARGAPGQPARAGSPTTRPPMDIGDAKALAAHADQEAANIQAGLTAAASATRPWTDVNTGPSVVSQGQPTPAVAPVAPPSTTAPVSAAPLPPREPVLTSPLQAPGAGAPLRVRDPYGNEFEMTQQQIDNRPGGSKDLTIIGPAAAPRVPDPYEPPATGGDPLTGAGAPQQPPLTGPDDPRIVREGGAPQAMTPPLQFAAMEPYRMRTPQIDPLAAQAMDPMQGMGEMPAALSHTQIAATPPWLLPASDLENLVKTYGEDTVFNWPGMPRSEVMA